MENTKKSSTAWIIVGIIGFIIVVGLLGSLLTIGMHQFGRAGKPFPMMGDRHVGIMQKGFGQKRVLGLGNISGKVTSVSGSEIKIKTSDGQEVTVSIAPDTSIYNQRKIASQSDIQVNNSITVVGRPNSSGIVQAEVINIK